MSKKPKDYTGPVDRLKAALQERSELPPAPDRAHTKRYAVAVLRELLIEQIATRGCTMQGLADYLSQHGLKIHPITLKLYLGDVRPYRQAYRQARQQAARSPVECAAPASSNEDSSKPPGPSPARSPTAPSLVPPDNRRPVFRQADEPASAARIEHPPPDKNAPVLAPQTPTPRLSSRFIPKPELPYDELIHQSEERKRRLAEAAARPGEDAAGQRTG